MAVTNYLYQYADGTTGNSPFQRDAQGNVMTNAAGGVFEGNFMGRSQPDGSVNQSPLGNVTSDGRVNLYGGYDTSADNYYSNANAAAWGVDSNVGQRQANGYGYDTGPSYATKPLMMGSAAAPGGAGTGATGYQGAGSVYGGGQAQQPAGGYSGGYSYSSTGQNPYLSQMGDVMTRQMTDNFNRKVMPQIGSQAMATGGYGGSRQGVIEANAMNDLNQQIGGALTNLYGQGYNTSLSHDLGLQNLGLGYANLDRSINNDNLNWQLQGANFGLGVYDRMQQGNQMGLNAATNIQNTPYNYWQNFSNQANSIGQGYGTQTQSTSGNPLMGALGGAQLGSRIGSWWGSQQPSNGTDFMFNSNLGMGD